MHRPLRTLSRGKHPLNGPMRRVRSMVQRSIPRGPDPRDPWTVVEGVAAAPSDWPARSLARTGASERYAPLAERRRIDGMRMGGGKWAGDATHGEGRARGSERDSTGSPDAHRARTAFQLAASRCRGRIVFRRRFPARATDRNRSSLHPRSAGRFFSVTESLPPPPSVQRGIPSRIRVGQPRFQCASYECASTYSGRTSDQVDSRFLAVAYNVPREYHVITAQ